MHLELGTTPTKYGLLLVSDMAAGIVSGDIAAI